MGLWQSSLESMEMSNFWQGKRVFLTGHTGFKGGWLSLWLQQLGADVTGYSLGPPTELNLFEAASVADGMTSQIGDIRNGEALRKAIQHSAPEIIFHLAAQPLVRRSYREPVETYSTNVMGLVHLLEAVRKTPSVQAVVNITSDKCYENHEWVWGYRENDPMGGFDPYSSSKGCAELVSAAYRKAFLHETGVALATARAGNVIGGGDWGEDRLLPDIFRAIAAKEAVRIRHPEAIRPWQHVLEPLGGYLLLAQRLYAEGTSFAEGWNFGPADTDAKTVRWIVEQITQGWGDSASWTLDAGDHPHEAHYLKLDCSKARQQLGWQPKLSLAEALEISVAWQRHYLNGDAMREITLQQVADYRNTR